MACNFRTALARTALCGALVGIAVTASGQEPPSARDPAPDIGSVVELDANEIIVPGERFHDDEAVETTVREISMRGRVSYRPIPRFNRPLCLHVAGLSDATSTQIKSRIADHATLLGLPLMEQGCRVNVLVVLVDDPEAFIAGYRKLQPWAFNIEAQQSIRAAMKRNDPAIVWFSTVEMGFDQSMNDAGAAPISRVDVPVMATFRLPTRVLVGGGDGFYTPLQPMILRTRHSGTIIFDTNRLKGFTARQVADYAAMRLFGNTQPKVEFSNDGALSILSMFETGPEGAAPALTLLDRAYLQGIHRLKPYDHPARLERSTQIAYRAMLEAACVEWAHCDQKAALTKTD